ncbi:MAG: 6-phosphofructokinase [Coxiellaceae bacterium]|nr:6-phosphofructokinase [Coxiellaceae bacterium]
MIKRLLILSSGGDAPGMNTAIRAAVRMAHHHNLDVYGTEAGYTGLIKESIFPLPSESVANIIMRGGTMLKTGRCAAFLEKSERDRARSFLKKQAIDAMVVLGGDGSFAGANLLEQEGGPKIIGVPCTIDNDIDGTEYTIGFDTACNTALEAIDKIRDTAFSLERNFIIEVMGRSSGFLAVEVGIAAGAEMILIPEFPKTVEQIVQHLQRPRRQKLGSLIVAAESGKPNSSIQIAKSIQEKSDIEYKVCILGHIQRGGTPTAFDRKIAGLMGASAVEKLLEGKSNLMLAMQNGRLTTTPFPDPEKPTRFFSDKSLLRLNEILCDT